MAAGLTCSTCSLLPGAEESWYLLELLRSPLVFCQCTSGLGSPQTTARKMAFFPGRWQEEATWGYSGNICYLDLNLHHLPCYRHPNSRVQKKYLTLSPLTQDSKCQVEIVPGYPEALLAWCPQEKDVAGWSVVVCGGGGDQSWSRRWIALRVDPSGG